MERATGYDPATCGLGSHRSTAELRPHELQMHKVWSISWGMQGGSERARAFPFSSYERPTGRSAAILAA